MSYLELTITEFLLANSWSICPYKTICTPLFLFPPNEKFKQLIKQFADEYNKVISECFFKGKFNLYGQKFCNNLPVTQTPNGDLLTIALCSINPNLIPYYVGMNPFNVNEKNIKIISDILLTDTTLPSYLYMDETYRKKRRMFWGDNMKLRQYPTFFRQLKHWNLDYIDLDVKVGPTQNWNWFVPDEQTQCLEFENKWNETPINVNLTL